MPDSDHEIILPSRPRVVLEEGNKGVYEIDGLYAGFGHTLGNAIRRVALSSLPGAAITTVKIDGVNHEFSTISGVKEDVVMILLNLKQIRFDISGSEPQKIILSVSGEKKVQAKDFKVPAQVKVLNGDAEIATLTDKKSKLKMEITVEKGLGYVPRETLKKEKVETGVIILDAIFTPIRRVNYEVENMRVGERTDYNRLRFLIETDGSISPKEAMENSLKILIKQLSSIVDFSDKETEKMLEETKTQQKKVEEGKVKKEKDTPETEEGEKEEEETERDFLKTRIEDLGLSNRTQNALIKTGIRTVGGLTRKKKDDLSQLEGIGDKAINEIKRALGNFGLILK